MILYRYLNSAHDVFCTEFKVIRETKYFYFFNEYSGEKRTHKTSKRRYAYPTKQEALFSFYKRKEKQIQILDYQLAKAKFAFSKSKKMLNDKQYEQNETIELDEGVGVFE